jgi:hypothetical protein
MSLNRRQILDYTQKNQIRAGRVTFADYSQRRELVNQGKLLGLNLYLPDNESSILPIIKQGEVNTSPEELSGYLSAVQSVQPPVVPVDPEPATSPDAPTNLSVTAGNGRLIISFTAGNDGGSPITNYKYAYSTNNGVSYTSYTAFDPSVTASPLTITGLTNGTPYLVKIRAENVNGDGDESSAVSGTPVAPTSNTPSAPTILSVVADDSQLTITFAPPESDGGFPIEGYVYNLSNEVDTWYYIINYMSEYTFSLEGLQNGVLYQIKLAAINENSQGEESLIAEGTPLFDGFTRSWYELIRDTNPDGSPLEYPQPDVQGYRAYRYSFNSGSNTSLDFFFKTNNSVSVDLETITGIYKSGESTNLLVGTNTITINTNRAIHNSEEGGLSFTILRQNETQTPDAIVSNLQQNTTYYVIVKTDWNDNNNTGAINIQYELQIAIESSNTPISITYESTQPYEYSTPWE